MRALNGNLYSDFVKRVVAIGAFERKAKALKTLSPRPFLGLHKFGTIDGVGSMLLAENRVRQS